MENNPTSHSESSSDTDSYDEIYQKSFDDAKSNQDTIRVDIFMELLQEQLAKQSGDLQLPTKFTDPLLNYLSSLKRI